MPEGGPARSTSFPAKLKRLVIWRFSDRKAGHDNQSLGLGEAIANETECEIHSLAPLDSLEALICLVTGRSLAFQSYPDPDLIIGAGHATHLSMLAARRSRGGRTVVLMTPTLPKRLFDLCLIPEHDQSGEADNVIVTRGALNRVQCSADKDKTSGLILVGGPSPHFAFDQQSVLEQVNAVLENQRNLTWTAATSRRTPLELTASLSELNANNLEVVPIEKSSPGWLAEKLARTSRVWVTEDSASMVYEALSSGAAVGLLSLKNSRSSRLSRGVEQLVSEGQVTRFGEWLEGAALKTPAAPLNETKRCARLILNRWPDLDP